ncbi:MAG: hypothetical protein MUE42_08050, partial [Opitutaceae bacterium]|nr:hypothetical protein [Opitutaceae bacterium]
MAEKPAGDRVDRLVVTATSLASLGAAAYAVSGLWRGQGSGVQIAPVSALSVGLLNAALLWWLWGGARPAARAVALGIALAAGAGACFWGLAGRGFTPEMMPATGFLLMGSALALSARCVAWGGGGERWLRRAGAALAAGLALTALVTGLVRLTGATELFPFFQPFSRGGSALAQFCLNLAILGALGLGSGGARRFMFITLAAFAGATGLAGWGYLRISLQDARTQAGVTLAAVADAKAEALAQWHGERVKDVWALAR